MKLFLLCMMCLLFSGVASAQITSSELRGTVVDDKKEGIPSAQITVTHQPTGTIYQLLTDVEGNFFLPQLKSGGPYSIVANYSSFKKFEANDLFLILGETKYVDIQLETTVTELEEIVVLGNNGQPIGTGTSVKADQINKLPTLNRSLQDFTRLTPQSSGNSYIGSNYRYNNLSIDGTANNDAFGFQEPSVGAGGSTAAGSPGALSKTQPISLDAVGEIQVALSPYDVKLGNFTGGSLNVVTKSGTNNWESSIYAVGRNQSITGRSADESRSKIGNYYDVQSGFRVGGALKKNKVFLFVNAEIGRRLEPVLNAPGSEGSAFKVSDIQALSDTLKNRYGYDGGTTGDVNIATTNNKFFLRMDFNLNKNNQLALRYNFVDGAHQSLTRSNNVLNFGSQGFTHNSISNNFVAELKTRFSDKIFNNLILGASSLHDFRETEGPIFPHIEITYNTSSNIFLGTYREAAVYQTYQKALELTDNVSVYLNKHKLTLGTHNEFYNFDYHFVTPYNGRWQYSSIANFYADKPSRIRGTYNQRDDSYENNYNNPSASFPVLLSSVYLQDDYAINRRLKISGGVRLDGNIFLKKQNTTQDLKTNTQFAEHTDGIKNQFIVSPRLGFNWDVLGDGNMKLRGGTGIFAGRAPFAWTAYSYIYNGNGYGNIDYRPASGTVVPLITEDFQQLEPLQPGRREINVVDNNFKLPRVSRSSLAVDLKLPAGFGLSLEGTYTKTLYDVLFKTLNLKDSTTTISGNGGDDRPVYLGSGNAGLVNPSYTSVFLLTNTKQGFRYSLSATVTKKIEKGPEIMVSYNYGQSKDISNGVRVSPQANWEWNQTINPNNPQLSYSNFDIRHRVVSSLQYEKVWNKRTKTILTGVFSGQSGSPYTYIYSGDLNRDGSGTNDLLYVPTSRTDINLVDYTDASGTVVTADQQWANLDAFITNDSYLKDKRGQHVERNGARTPWNAQLDLHLAQEISFKGKRKNHVIQISADVINVLNAINYRWNRQYFVPNTTNAGYSLITAKSVSSSTGAATFTFNNPTSKPWQVDAIASRVQVQFGLRYTF